MLGALADVFSGIPKLASIGRSVRLAVDLTRSLRVYLSQGLDYTTSSVESRPKPATSVVGQGTKELTLADTAYQLTATSTPCKRVYVNAKEANAGIVIWGSSSVTTAGACVPKPSQMGNYMIDIDDVSKLWFASSGAADDVDWTAVSW